MQLSLNSDHLPNINTRIINIHVYLYVGIVLVKKPLLPKDWTTQILVLYNFYI